jgi:hypothetical protein
VHAAPGQVAAVEVIVDLIAKGKSPPYAYCIMVEGSKHLILSFHDLQDEFLLGAIKTLLHTIEARAAP